MIFTSIFLLALVGGQTDMSKDDQTKQQASKANSSKRASIGARGKLRPVTKEEFDRAAPEKISGAIGAKPGTTKKRSQ